MFLEVARKKDPVYPFSETIISSPFKKQDASTTHFLELQESDRSQEVGVEDSLNPLAPKPTQHSFGDQSAEENEEEDVVNQLQALPSESLCVIVKPSSPGSVSNSVDNEDRSDAKFASKKITIGSRDNFGVVSQGLFFEGVSSDTYEAEDKDKKRKLTGTGIQKTKKPPRKLPALQQSDAQVITTAEVVLNYHIKAGKVVIRSSQIPVPLTFAKKAIRYGRVLEAVFFETRNFFSRDYVLYLEEETKRLISCKRESFTLNSRFIMRLDNEELGEVKGNFWGSYYNIFEDSILVGTVRFHWSCSRSDSQIEIYLKNNEFPPEQIQGYSLETPLSEIYEHGSNSTENKIRKFINKKPQFNIKTGVYSLNLSGLARMASTRNMVLIEEKTGNQLLLVAKKDENHFSIRMNHPLSVRTGMSILAAVFDSKLVSE